MTSESLRNTLYKSGELVGNVGSSARALGQSLKRFAKESAYAATSLRNLRPTKLEASALMLSTALFIIPTVIGGSPENQSLIEVPTPTPDIATAIAKDATPTPTTNPELRVTVTGSDITPVNGATATKAVVAKAPTPKPEPYDPNCRTGVIDGIRYVTPQMRGLGCNPELDYNTLMKQAEPAEATDFDHLAGTTDPKAGDYYRWAMILPDGRVVSIAAPTPILSTRTGNATP